MTIIGTTIATTVEDIRDLLQHCIVHNIEGRVNLTINEDGVKVWQPENMPVAESVERFPSTDKYCEPQPTDLN